MKTFEKEVKVRTNQILTGQSLKDFLIHSAILHREADELAKGQYWQNGKGCAVGCTLYDIKAKYTDDHSFYDWFLGISTGIAQLQDSIFEDLENHLSQQWPERFWRAVPVGVDLSNVTTQFMVWILSEELKFDREEFPNVAAAIDNICNLHRAVLAGNPPTPAQWRAVREIADIVGNIANFDSIDENYDAKNAAECALSAENSTLRDDDNTSCESAATFAADNAVNSACWNAWIATKKQGKNDNTVYLSNEWDKSFQTTWSRFADKLIEILENYK